MSNNGNGSLCAPQLNGFSNLTPVELRCAVSRVAPNAHVASVAGSSRFDGRRAAARDFPERVGCTY